MKTKEDFKGNIVVEKIDSFEVNGYVVGAYLREWKIDGFQFIRITDYYPNLTTDTKKSAWFIVLKDTDKGISEYKLVMLADDGCIPNLETITRFLALEKMKLKYSYVKTICHPKTDLLKVHIHEYDGAYFFEEDGDFFDRSMCPFPLVDCEKSALNHLDNIYHGGDHVTIGEVSERQTFNSN